MKYKSDEAFYVATKEDQEDILKTFLKGEALEEGTVFSKKQVEGLFTLVGMAYHAGYMKANQKNYGNDL